MGSFLSEVKDATRKFRVDQEKQLQLAQVSLSLVEFVLGCSNFAGPPFLGLHVCYWTLFL